MLIYNPASGGSFNGIDGVTTNATAIGTWQDWDLSGTVGSRRITCLVKVKITNSAGETGKIRENGTTLNNASAQHSSAGNEEYSGVVIQNTDTNGILEIYVENDFNDVLFALNGYWD